MGLTVGASAIAQEREQGTLEALLAQPLTPPEILLGKFSGAALALASAILLGFGASGFIIASYGWTEHIVDYLSLLSLTLLLDLAHLSMGFCI